MGGKRKNKTNKNIFVALNPDDITQHQNPDDKATKNNKEENLEIQYTNNKDTNSILLTNSVFKKTEQIDKEKISQIISNIKSTTKLEQIQGFALELGLSIISGSTKDGKPKNKTKNELIDEIKKMN